MGYAHHAKHAPFQIDIYIAPGVSKKTSRSIKPRKLEEKKTKKTKLIKKWLNQL